MSDTATHAQKDCCELMSHAGCRAEVHASCQVRHHVAFMHIALPALMNGCLILGRHGLGMESFLTAIMASIYLTSALSSFP